MRLILICFIFVSVSASNFYQDESEISANIFIDEKFTAEFQYYKRSSGEASILTTGDVLKLQASGFNFNTRTVFLVHGFRGVGNDVLYKIKDDILLRWDVNVIFVNWSKASVGIYTVVQRRIDDIAKQVTNFVDFITDQNYSIDNVQFVGFSLGAHLSGLACRHVKNGKVQSIIGLDPAGVNYYSHIESNRLKKGDAKIVEVIHGSVLGYFDPIGDVDFYVNGGVSQPNCGIKFASCSHLRILDLYKESIWSEKGFAGIKCTDKMAAKHQKCGNITELKMGEIYPKPWSPGIYLVTTKNESPYAV